MDFYTRKGDGCETGLLGSERVSKSSLRIEVIGCLDEVNAVLGIVRSQSQKPEIQSLTLEVQKKMYQLMTETAATAANAKKFHLIDEAAVLWLEENISALSAQVIMPREFIVPGDTPGGAFISHARTLVRKAERRMAELCEKDEIGNMDLLRFLNRLSSLCFVMELFENSQSGKGSQTLVK